MRETLDVSSFPTFLLVDPAAKPGPLLVAKYVGTGEVSADKLQTFADGAAASAASASS